MAQSTTLEQTGYLGARFAMSKFRPTTLPATLVARPALQDRLSEGAGKWLTVVTGSAGTGKSVLLASWAAARPPGVTSWLSCDRADADPVRFWTAFIEAPKVVAPRFGDEAADLLAMDSAVSADVIASIANDAAKLPAGCAVIVDDFQMAAAAVAEHMTDLVERWPSETVQLVLLARRDAPLRLHRLRMAGQLCEIRDRDLFFSQAESRDLLANFGVQLTAEQLALLHERSEGWVAALQMAALSLRGSADPAQIARALEIRGGTLADYFITEVLDRQPSEVARFMLDTSILAELTAGTCMAVTGQPDAAALLRTIDAANLFLTTLDDERTSFRYHQLVRRVLRVELRARDLTREQTLQLRAAEWYKSAGETRLAARHFIAAKQADQALTVLQDTVVPDYLQDPALPPALDLSTVDASRLVDAPDKLLAVAADLLLSGDIARGGEYLDLLERATTLSADSRLAARFATMRAYRHALIGELDQAAAAALTARATQQRADLADKWNPMVPLVLMHVSNGLEDFPAVEREAAAALAMPEAAEPVKLVLVPGSRALAAFEAGYLVDAVAAARAADAQARRLGFGQHLFAVDHLRVLAGLALERRDLNTAEHLTEQVLSITEHRRPIFEFLALLDRAQIWAARGLVREALATVEEARHVLAGTKSVLLARADELEAVLRLSLLDLRTPAELASKLPAVRCSLLRARIALVAGNHLAAVKYLRAPSLGDLPPRLALVRQILLAAAAMERGDPMTAAILAPALESARSGEFLNTVVATAPQVTSYLIESSVHPRPDRFTSQLVRAAVEVRATKPDTQRSRQVLPDPLTAAELRILNLLPTSTYLQMAATLYVSRNTVKTHLRSIYQKLGVTCRAEALERAVDLRLL